MAKPITTWDEDIARAHCAGLSLRAIARKYDLSYGLVRNSLVRQGMLKNGEGTTRDKGIAGCIPAERAELRRLKDEVARLRKAAEEHERDVLDAARVREIHGLASGVEHSPPGWCLEDKPGSGFSGVPVLLSSDWHLQEVVRPDEVGGVNEFNHAVAAQRVRNLVQRTVDLCEHHMTGRGYPGIVYAMLGDIITGNIHEELARTNDRTIMQGCIDAFDLNVWVISELAAKFGRVFVPCVPGNHGRSTLKPVMKGRVETSYEWLVYCMLERHFKDAPEIRFLIPTTGDAHFTIYGHRFFATHGDVLGVKGGDGIIGAIGPIMRGRTKTAASEAQVEREFDTLLIGHYHTYMAIPASGLIVNGSLKGYDEYARLGLRSRYQRAIQALFFVHPKHGMTYQIPVFVDDKPARDASDGWVSWRA